MTEYNNNSHLQVGYTRADIKLSLIKDNLDKGSKRSCQTEQIRFLATVGGNHCQFLHAEHFDVDFRNAQNNILDIMYIYVWAFLVVQAVKNLPAMQETQI